MIRQYAFISPSLDGVISNDLLYFEGLRRPTRISLIKDNPALSAGNVDLLEKYFNDLHNLFMRKLSDFALAEKITDEECLKLQALLQEIIKVKGLLVYNS